MRIRKSSNARARMGMSLLEVLVATAIFLISMVAIGQLLNVGTARAMDLRQRTMAMQYCQSLVAKLAMGAMPLQSLDESAYEEDSDWLYSMSCEQGAATGIWNVTVRVFREDQAGYKTEASLTQMIIDPSIRGSTADVAATTSSTNPDVSTTGGSSSSTTGASGGSGSSGSSGGSGNTGSSGASSGANSSSGSGGGSRTGATTSTGASGGSAPSTSNSASSASGGAPKTGSSSTSSGTKGR